MRFSGQPVAREVSKTTSAINNLLGYNHKLRLNVVPLVRLERTTRGLGIRSGLYCSMFQHYAMCYFEAKIYNYFPPTTAEYYQELCNGLAERLAKAVSVMS